MARGYSSREGAVVSTSPVMSSLAKALGGSAEMTFEPTPEFEKILREYESKNNG